jgi:hypothetical protein
MQIFWLRGWTPEKAHRQQEGECILKSGADILQRN